MAGSPEPDQTLTEFMTDEQLHLHRWHPIEDLPDTVAQLAIPQLATLRQAWKRQRKDLHDSPALNQFVERQVRQWSIQTGILERLYTLDDGITLTLVEQGFDAAYVPHGATDISPLRLIRILEDHREAAEGLFAFVKNERELSTSYVKELHAALCRSQETSDAVNSLGRMVQVSLVKGAYKTQPNNPRDVVTGKVVFEYCPPEHVDLEMERLVALHLAHTDVPSEIEAAWLHHRFVQIHPFQDGNGRVARALATLVCLRDGGFPLLVMASDKARYIESLRAADRRDLGPFIRLVARLQESAFTNALSLSQQVTEEQAGVDAIVADARRRIEESATRRSLPVHQRAERLVQLAHDALAGVAEQITTSMAGVARAPKAHVTVGEPDGLRLFHEDTLRIAERLNYRPNLGVETWDVNLRIAYTPLTYLVVSFHHLGARDQEVMVATAFLTQRQGLNSQGGAASLIETQPICDSPLFVTTETDEAALTQSFQLWLQDAIRRGMDLWRRSL